MPSGYYNFAAIRGTWGNHNYYLIQCPIKIAVKIFSFDSSEVPKNLRELQSLDRRKVQSIIEYISGNPQQYTATGIVVVTDNEPIFTPIQQNLRELGTIKIPLESTMIICSGQNQQAAIQESLVSGKLNPNDTIPVIIVPDLNFTHAITIYMMLSDNNRNRSQKILVKGDELSQLIKELIEKVPVFHNRVERKKTTISNRSSAMFTLSAVYRATQALLDVTSEDHITRNQEDIAHEYWQELSEIIPEWREIAKGSVTAAHLRHNYVHSHTVFLIALGLAGNTLVAQYPDDWKVRLRRLADVDWSRHNVDLWEGLTMSGGRIRRTNDSITSTADAIQQILGLYSKDTNTLG